MKQPHTNILASEETGNVLDRYERTDMTALHLQKHASNGRRRSVRSHSNTYFMLLMMNLSFVLVICEQVSDPDGDDKEPVANQKQSSPNFFQNSAFGSIGSPRQGSFRRMTATCPPSCSEQIPSVLGTNNRDDMVKRYESCITDLLSTDGGTDAPFLQRDKIVETMSRLSNAQESLLSDRMACFQDGRSTKGASYDLILGQCSQQTLDADMKVAHEYVRKGAAVYGCDSLKFETDNVRV